jgi:hypothetical protein
MPEPYHPVDQLALSRLVPLNSSSNVSFQSPRTPVGVGVCRVGGVGGVCFRGSGRCVGVGFGVGADMIGHRASPYAEGGGGLVRDGLLTRTAARPDPLADARWETSIAVAVPSSMTPTRKRPVMAAAAEGERRLLCLRR